MVQQNHIVFHFLPVLDQARNTRNCLPVRNLTSTNTGNNNNSDNNITTTTSSSNTIPAACLEGTLTNAGSMQCLSIRNCDVFVDVDWFQALVSQAVHHIQANKYSPHERLLMQKVRK